jgi:uncharacterized protein YihD (DUF1040 family)
MIMRDPKRIPKVLERIREIWERNPDLRLAQLVVNATKMVGHEDASQSRIFNLEDDQLLKGIDKLEQLEKI